jgi:hypothetical protein
LKFNFPQDITCVVITPRLFRFSARVYIELGFTPSENRHEGKQAKSRDMVAVEARRGKS